MIKRKLLICALMIAVLFSACALDGSSADGFGEGVYHARERASRFNRDISKIDFTGITYTPWDIGAAADLLERQSKRDWTIMIYMIGSDLESLEGAATADIAEMLESGVDTDAVNVILLTGGTNLWRNNVIPENECVIWRIEAGELVQVSGIGLLNMGDPGTLAGFINFSMRNFPAYRYGLIFWDHAGGSIAGYGHDEKFDSALTLLEMNYAFERSDISHTKLEFMGFDACLMATVEMAVIAAPYANYLIASQDLEPGDGWDYTFLGALGRNPEMDGAAIGKIIADSFMDFYGRRSPYYLTLSVTDLSRAGYVMDAMDALMAVASHDLLRNRENTFAVLAKRRGRTKTFGNGSPRDNECDMVDLADMARKLKDIYPDEARGLLDALDYAVVYNRHNSDIDLGGLTTFYIYGGKETVALTLDIYASLGMSGTYTAFLRSFADILTGGGPSAPESWLKTHRTLWKPVDESWGRYAQVGIKNAAIPDLVSEDLWPSIGGEFVCLYEIESSSDRSLYAVPALHNGRDVNLIVLRSAEHPNGIILGARQREGFVLQKGYDEITSGDTVAFYHRVKDFSGAEKWEQWRKSEPHTVTEAFGIDWRLPDDSYYYGYLQTDIHQNEHFSSLTRLAPKAA